MTLNSTAPLKWSAALLAVLWTCTMPRWIGATQPVEIAVLAFCGVVCSFGWYDATRFFLGRVGVLPPERDETAEARRGKIYPWIVFVIAMITTRQLTVHLLDAVEPLSRAPDWQPAKALFIIFVWPGLMWALRPLIRRYLPPPKRRAGS